MAIKEEKHQNKYKLFILNIVMQSNHEDREKLYIDILSKIINSHLYEFVSEDKAITIFEPFHRERNEVKYLYGKLAKGLILRDEYDQSVILSEGIINKEPNNKDILRHIKDTDYIFIPSIHRFAIIARKGISIYDVKRFFEKVLPKVIESANEQFIVEIENEPKIIEEILEAKFIHSIELEVSYTNDDTLNEMGQAFHNRLKKSQIGRLKLKADADHNGFIEGKGEELIEGSIELAKSYGQITSAVITDNDGEKKRVSTTHRPQKIDFKSSEDDRIINAFNMILKYFRHE